ncbi:MAG: hypothetical protein H7338_00270 [Candidatus Sericytochromatia bacterium]|nr:hypothetical protein [Candidatus Sericytochromatia bacterium]
MSDATLIVTRWLAAYHATDWHTLWTLSAPDALTMIGPQVLPKHVIAITKYVEVMDSIVNAQDGKPVPDFEILDVQAVEVAGGTVALVRARERHDGVSCVLAFEMGAEGLVRGVTVDPPSAERAAVQAAADLAQMPRPTTRTEAFRTVLDHAYARRHRGIDRPLRSLPEARFTCQGRGECCRVGLWNIAVSDNQRLPLSRMTTLANITPFTLHTPAGAPTFADPEAATERHKLATGIWPDCHQMADDGNCGLHGALGWQPISVCQLYPVHPIPTPDGYDVTAAYSCLTVCLNQGLTLAEQTDNLRGRIWPFQFRMAEVPELLSRTMGTDADLPWQVYRQWEAEMLESLWQRDAHGLPDLSHGSRILLGRAGPGLSRRALDIDDLFQRITKPGIPEGGWREGWCGGGSWEAWLAIRHKPITVVDEGDLVARFLRAQLFRKHGLIEGETGVAFPWGMTVLISAMVKADARFRAWRGDRDRTTQEDLIGAVRSVEQVILHDKFPEWLATLPDSPVESPMSWQACQAV